MPVKPKQRWFLREWRKYKGLSQERLGARIGTTKGVVSDLENGKVRWNSDHLHAFAEALGVDPVDLLVRNPTDPEGIWSIWDRVADKNRDTARRVLEQLAEPPTEEEKKKSSA